MGSLQSALAGGAAVLIAASASAQGVSINSTNQPLIKGDPNKIVCKKEETVGTRLGARKLCLTIAQWNEKAREHREFTDEMQSGTWGRQSDPAVESRLPGGSPQ